MGEARRRKQLGLPPQNPKRPKVSSAELRQTVEREIIQCMPIIPLTAMALYREGIHDLQRARARPAVKMTTEEPELNPMGYDHYKTLCHWCGGSGKDEDAEKAASPDRCPNCGGTGIEPDEEGYEDDEEDW